MKDLNLIIASNLKRIREEKKLSLEKVADITGVSKSMLGQIERGESSPTINTIWKIAIGLKVSFTSLINSPQDDAMIVHKSEVEPLIEDNGKYRVYPVFPYEDGRRFEMYIVEIEPDGHLRTDTHGEKTQEFITVVDGELTVLTNEKEYTVHKGDSITFRADKCHTYHNPGVELTRLSMVIYYSL
ncbi:helix-turn-helix domain-containing protein [Sporomusa malonica]|uniref:Transcriptional regulator, XRE family with cupin sensor n=1 Tax=Sporomusa malonica TaxID=112901 RepID=A0A1W2CXA8_9FIRM|nr:XRE family transcriptional regulator [Sporomusa malonica]SMC89790.1 transcriptional regulator, XRE family with cupin sensor [Sporomusa malonica]